MSQESKELVELIDIETTDNMIKNTKIPHAPYLQKKHILSKILNKHENSTKKQAKPFLIKFAFIPVCALLVVAFTFTLFQSGAVYIAHAENPNPEFVDAQYHLTDVLFSGSEYGKEKRKEMVKKFKVPMDMYARLQNACYEYELYSHQHTYYENWDLEKVDMGDLSTSKDDIKAYYKNELETKTVEYEQNVKNILGNRYNDFTNWFVEWYQDYDSPVKQPVEDKQQEEPEDQRMLRLNSNDAVRNEQIDNFDSTFKTACEAAKLTPEETNSINHVFGDMGEIYERAYTLYEQRIHEFGKSKKSVSTKYRDEMINEFQEKVPGDIQNILGSKYEAFEPYVNQLIDASKQSHFFYYPEVEKMSEAK